MYFQFANVLVFFLLAFVLCGLMLGLGLLLRPSNPHPGKLTTYECGEPPSGNAWINFNIRFYLIALVFVIPVATVFRDWIARGQGAFALAEITLFVAILAVGLVYVWVKGDLEWLKRLPQYRGEHAAEPLRRDAA
ncbi:MAG: NADH-quinone oxidoreductase subunit A [Deltaproteobacteria bacterium]|nr:MAG: NADH-quinone oxidoreductase subunit A [Deltaproteobacteria bacterium]